jgi:hypothetical protein
MDSTKTQKAARFRPLCIFGLNRAFPLIRACCEAAGACQSVGMLLMMAT